MKRTVFTIAAIPLILTGASGLFGQDAESVEDTPTAPVAVEAAESADAPAPKAAESRVPGVKAEAFGKVFTEWKKLLSELRALRDEFPDADVERRIELKKRYAELIAEGEAMQGDLVAAAVEAFEEAPLQDAEIAQFLGGILTWEAQTDDYEIAFEIGQGLIASGVEETSVYAMTADAAFCTNQFDLAEKYFQLAGDGVLDDVRKAHKQQVGYYKAQWAKEEKIREAEAKADDLPRVEIATEDGTMIIELFENEAPNTVANFISLVKKGFYNGLTFHRVMAGFMAQGGCPDGTGGGGPGYRIECECVKPDSRKHFRGSLSMAHAGPDTGGSQFFLCFGPAIGLDGPPAPSHHTVFGRVVEGMDVLAKINRPDKPKGETPADPEKILSMKVLRDRGHEYQPKTLPEMR